MIKINGYAIDAALSEDHDREAEVTEFPVEQGGNVTDHVRIKPIVVQIKGCVSNTPIGDVARLRTNASLEPAEEAMAFLVATFEAAKEIRIETSIKTYDNMIMESLSLPDRKST